jgi:hydrogenase nickel incorporation protein HypA/HybF
VHELSIVSSIVNTVSEAVTSARARRVNSVTLRVGELSGVVEDALLFSYDIATKETLLEGSKLIVRRLPVVIRCENCGEDRELPNTRRFRCPVCDTPSGDIRQGRELEIESVEIEEADDHADR